MLFYKKSLNRKIKEEKNWKKTIQKKSLFHRKKQGAQ